MYDIFGIENCIVDIVFKVDEEVLKRLGLVKGACNLVDPETSQRILSQVMGMPHQNFPAGACTNTIMGIADIGASAVFCGVVGNDDYGDFFIKELSSKGVKTYIEKREGTTGTNVNLVTPDTERSMAVHLGVSTTLTIEQIPSDEIKNSKIVYLTGFILEDPKLRDVAIKAMKDAKESACIVAVDLADAQLIRRNKDLFIDIVKNHVDILFVNEYEAEALTDLFPENAIKHISTWVDIAVVKVGSNGSYVSNGGEIVRIDAVPAEAVDSTGAGDLYAAGFLFALTHKVSMKDCGNFGSLIAAEIVSKHGTTLDPHQITKVRDAWIAIQSRS